MSNERSRQRRQRRFIERASKHRRIQMEQAARVKVAEAEAEYDWDFDTETPDPGVNRTHRRRLRFAGRRPGAGRAWMRPMHRRWFRENPRQLAAQFRRRGRGHRYGQRWQPSSMRPGKTQHREDDE